MRAARYYGKEDVRVEQIDEPTCGKGQVKVAPAFVGICGSDIHEFSGGPTVTPVQPHPVTKEKIPITLGHEFSGVVTETGPDVTDFKNGQNVVVRPTIYCSSCGACKSGMENTCHQGGTVGLSGYGGGLSDYVVVPHNYIFPLPDNLSLEIGALVEPLSVAWHAVSASSFREGDKVLILGGGPIGLAILQCLKAQKAGVVILSEMAPARQRFAKEFGADHVCDPRIDDIVAKSRELCGGEQGPDIVYDCAGVPASLTTAIAAIKSRGTVVNVAIWEKEVLFNPNMLLLKEGKYIAALAYQKEDFVAVIEALRTGLLKPQSMITKRIKLENVVEDGIMQLIRDKDNQVKILVDIKS